MLNKIKKYTLDLIFPIKCLGCGTWDIWLCPKCQKKIYNPQKIGALYYLDSYQNPLIQKIIHQFKYNYSQELAPILSTLLNQIIDQSFDYIIPVPLHKKRYLERGFNQSTLLCQNINIPLLEKGLIRTRYTPPQAQLNEKKRCQNLRNSFICPLSLKNKKILLIDDVYTTGSTIKECSRALKQAQVAEIYKIVLAKG